MNERTTQQVSCHDNDRCDCYFRYSERAECPLSRRCDHITPVLRQLHCLQMSVSALCSRSRGSYISRLLDWLPRTSQTTVAFCRTLAVAHCGPTPMTRGSCSCREHITNSVIGISRPPVLRRLRGFFSPYTVERLSTWTPAAGTYLRLLQTISENSFIWRSKRLVIVLNV